MRLCGISSRFQLLSPSTGQVTHALLTRPPLSHQSLPPEGFCLRCFVRLACVKHAASVHPEPGSNSRLKFLIHFRMTLAILPSITVVLEFIISDDVHWKSFIHFQGWLLFNYQCSCFACCRFSNNSFILSRLFCFVNNFFIFFFVIQNLESIKFFCLNCCLSSQLVYNTMYFDCCQHTFLIFLFLCICQLNLTAIITSSDLCHPTLTELVLLIIQI